MRTQPSGIEMLLSIEYSNCEMYFILLENLNYCKLLSGISFHTALPSRVVNRPRQCHHDMPLIESICVIFSITAGRLHTERERDR